MSSRKFYVQSLAALVPETALKSQSTQLFEAEEATRSEVDLLEHGEEESPMQQDELVDDS